MGIDISFVQENISSSRKGTLRGLHFQSFPGQDKLVTCIEGEIWDVVVDLRPESKTYSKWEAVVLSEKGHQQLFIPKGFAHGFCALSSSCRVLYKMSAYYNPETERSIRWNDPNIKIDWPIVDPILSNRDQKSPFLKEIQDVALDRG